MQQMRISSTFLNLYVPLKFEGKEYEIHSMLEFTSPIPVPPVFEFALWTFNRQYPERICVVKENMKPGETCECEIRARYRLEIEEPFLPTCPNDLFRNIWPDKIPYQEGLEGIWKWNSMDLLELDAALNHLLVNQVNAQQKGGKQL